MNNIKKTLKKSKIITSLYHIIIKFIFSLRRIIINFIFSLRNTNLQGLMTKQEKRMRKKFGIGLRVIPYDSKRFWFFYNITQNIVAQNNPSDWLIVDVGASKGWYTEPMMKLLPQSTFLMYEPLNQFKEANSAFAKIHDRVYYVQKALGNEEGSIQFYENIGCFGLSSTHKINPHYRHFHKDFDNQNYSQYTVPMSKLDNEIDNNPKFNKFDNIFLKMDVQGGEMNVLKGSDFLLDTKIKVVHMEMQIADKYILDYSFIDLITLMYSKGFVIFDILGEYKEKNSEIDLFGFEGQLTECEMIFVKKELSLCKV